MKMQLCKPPILISESLTAERPSAYLIGPSGVSDESWSVRFKVRLKKLDNVPSKKWMASPYYPEKGSYSSRLARACYHLVCFCELWFFIFKKKCYLYNVSAGQLFKPSYSVMSAGNHNILLCSFFPDWGHWIVKTGKMHQNERRQSREKLTPKSN